MKSLYFALFLLLGCALPALSQNVRVDGVVQSAHGPAPNVFVAVCSQPANLSVTPCTTRVALCSSLTDVVCTSPNPVNSDGLGNYFFYIPAGGTYTYQFYGNGLQTRSFVDQQPGSATSTGGVLLTPLGDQTIVGSHQLINRGTGQTGFPFTSFDAAIQAFAVNPATGTVAVSGQTSGSGNIGVQGVQTGGGQGSGIFGLGEGLNSATFGGFFTSFANTTTGNPYIGTALYGQLNLTVTGSLPQDTGANAAEGKIYGGTVQSLSSYITAGNQDNAGGTGGVATNSYGYNVSAAMNAGTPGATINAAFHAKDQGSGANNYGILLDGVTHNWLGQGPTQANVIGMQDASLYSGATWLDKAIAAASAISNSGTVTIPDSLASVSAFPSGTIPTGITLKFTGSGTFGFCTLTLGKFSKVYANGALLQMNHGGSGCTGITHTTAATMQETDKTVLSGVRVSCNTQPGSTGIFFSGGSSQDYFNNVTVSFCGDSTANTAGLFLQDQFGSFYSLTLQQNYVNLKMYTTNAQGGVSSNTFYDLKTVSPGSGVNVILSNTNTGGQTQSDTVFINHQCQNGAIACVAMFGGTSGALNAKWVGAAPELNHGGASSIVIDGFTIKKSGAWYVKNANLDLDHVQFSDGTADPDMVLESNSYANIDNPSGYGPQFGKLVSADSTSFVNLSGTVATNGEIVNATSFPASITAGRGAIAGAPISYLNSAVPNFFTGNALTPPFSSTTGTSSTAVASDLVYGLVNTVTFAASAGSPSSNEIQIANAVSAGATAVTSDYVFSILVMASVTTNVSLYSAYSGGNSGFLAAFGNSLTLQGGQWTRVLMYSFGIGAGNSAFLTLFPADSAGATVSFTRLESLAYPTGVGIVTGLQGASIRAQIIQSGAVNPNGFNVLSGASANISGLTASLPVCTDGSKNLSTTCTASSGAVYYVDNCVVTGNDSNNGTSPTTPWLTVAKVASSSFNAGDQVLFQRGCTWREELDAPSGGSLGKPVTYGAYGSGPLPRITGADVQASWTLDAGSVYYNAGYASDPGTVATDGILLKKMASKAAVVNSTQWFYDSGATRVYIFGNPSGHTVEVGSRAIAFNTNGHSFVTADRLWLESGTSVTTFVGTGVTNFTLSNSLINNTLIGFSTSNTVGQYGALLNNTFANAYQDDITLGTGNISNWTISGNSVSYAGYANPSGGTQCQGIFIDIGSGTGVLVENNNVFQNGQGPGNPTANSCHGIYLNTGAVTIRGNWSHNNIGSGIQSHANNSVLVYNIVTSNCIGFLVEVGPTGVKINNNYIGNNGNLAQPSCSGASAGLFAQSNGTVVAELKNNIFDRNIYGSNFSDQQIYFTTGAPAPTITVSNNNIFCSISGCAAGTSMANWQGASKTFTQWQALGYDANGLSSDPLLRSAVTNDFRPSSNSPVIDAGANLGTAFQFGLNNASRDWPFTTVNQDGFGAGWDIGPYVYNPNNDIVSGPYLATINGATWNVGSASELVTLNTGGTTTDSVQNLLPANSIIDAVVARVTTTITAACTGWELGDATTAARFTSNNATLTAGTTTDAAHIGTFNNTGIASATTGIWQASAAKLRVTCAGGNPGAGAIRETVFYRTFVPPQN